MLRKISATAAFGVVLALPFSQIAIWPWLGAVALSLFGWSVRR